MPILAEVTRLAKGLDIVGRRLAPGKARNDVVKLEPVCGAAAHARRAKQVSVFPSFKFFRVVGNGKRSETIELAPNAAEVKLPSRPVIWNVEGSLASVARHCGSSAVGLTVALFGAKSAKPLFTSLGFYLKERSTHFASAFDGSLTQNGSACAGTRSRRPLGQMAGRLVECATAYGACLMSGFLVSRHGSL